MTFVIQQVFPITVFKVIVLIFSITNIYVTYTSAKFLIIVSSYTVIHAETDIKTVVAIIRIILNIVVSVTV